MTAYRGRFAPSPSGALHLGTARTALLAWLRARQAGGMFLLRLDDLDRARIREGAREAILDDLRWLGLDWDGPLYVQSERLPLYEQAFQSLKERFLYPCSCSRADLAGALSAPHGEEGPLYPGLCRKGPLQSGRAPAWRFRMDSERPFADLLCGPWPGLKDDFVVRRADGTFAYQFASAVDDAELAMTEVVRGADLLGSASRQSALLDALGREEPRWLHVPLLLGPDGVRLSKRHDSVSLADYRRAGWTSQAVLGLLAWSLGLLPKAEAREAASLIPCVDLARLPRSDSRFEGPWPK